MAKKKSITLGVDKEYQAKWDLDTLRQAKEIESNAARMRAAQNYAKEQVKMLGGIVSGSGKAPAKKTTSKKK
jgi:hypothetical protein